MNVRKSEQSCAGNARGTAALEAVLYTTFMIIPVLIIARGVTSVGMGAIGSVATSRYLVLAEGVNGKRYEDRVSVREGAEETRRYTETENAKVVRRDIAYYPKLEDPFSASVKPTEGKDVDPPPPCDGLLEAFSAIFGCATYAVNTMADIAKTFQNIDAETAGFPGYIIKDTKTYNYRDPSVLYRPKWDQRERFSAFDRRPFHYDDRVGPAHQIAKCEWCAFDTVMTFQKIRALADPDRPVKSDWPGFPECGNLDLEKEKLDQYKGMKDEAEKREKEMAEAQKRMEEIGQEKLEVQRQAEADRQAARDRAEADRKVIRDKAAADRQAIIDSDRTQAEKDIEIAKINAKEQDDLEVIDDRERAEIDAINKKEQEDLDRLESESDELQKKFNPE